METTAAGYGDGRSAAPQRDWIPSRLGPAPPAAMSEIMGRSFTSILAACGTPPSLFDSADGTSQRESFRRYLTMMVQPLAKMLEAELSAQLAGTVRLDFDGLYAHDLVGRASAFSKLVANGVAVDKALATSGLLVPEV